MAPVLKRQGHSLSNGDRPGWPHFVTLHLRDAIPPRMNREWRREIGEAMRRKEEFEQRELFDFEWAAIRRKFLGRIEEALDEGHGGCALRDDGAARVVDEALTSFDGERYRLLCRCVMPNHVHAIFEATSEFSVDRTVSGWRLSSARRVNVLLGRRGRLWQAEYLDHPIRNGSDLAKFATYVLENPRKAGLGDWPWVGSVDLTKRIAEMDALGFREGGFPSG